MTIADARAIARGGPTAATDYLARSMGERIFDALFPGVGEALRLAENGVIQRVLQVATGINFPGLQADVTRKTAAALYRAIGPRGSRDPGRSERRRRSGAGRPVPEYRGDRLRRGGGLAWTTPKASSMASWPSSRRRWTALARASARPDAGPAARRRDHRLRQLQCPRDRLRADREGRRSDAVARRLPRWVTLCFLQGAGLPDPDGLLRGGGSRVRHVRLHDRRPGRSAASRL